MAAGATFAATIVLASIIRRLRLPVVRQEFA
jgi:hypothetical protein